MFGRRRNISIKVQTFPVLHGRKRDFKNRV